MKSLGFARCLLSIGFALATLNACGGGQAQGSMRPPIESGTAAQSLGHASSSYQVLLRFGPGHAALSPLLNVNGVLYGTTDLTGKCHRVSCHGTVFTISTTGEKKIVYSFKGGVSDGAGPVGPLTFVSGTLYGTTNSGGGTGCGGSGCGTVYSISASGSEKVLYAFQGGSDGRNPSTGVIDVNGTLYGTTAVGGGTKNCAGQNTGCGTVYSVSTSGSETVLYRFVTMSDGWLPNSPLIDVNGTLYGTTTIGGVECGNKTEFDGLGCGVVYSMTPSGSETVLHTFSGSSLAVANPTGGLLDVNGTLYGMTQNALAKGAIYKMGLSGDKYKVVHYFQGGSDGVWPFGVLIGVNGLIYGITDAGGSNNRGTVFSLTTSGKETVLYSFDGEPNGDYPQTGLTAVQNTLYGVTSAGGRPRCYDGCGTIFALSL
jgi:uncharacterized repeat protein (TIGR03803 family)